ncbi:NAD(P)H-binding protein [Actinoplanes sp. N902-109]|uniref:NAD(P)H-binding protein n=1 Tax=Actinoplanes sp. (strain N902-109) TaxID=649831 RepID=UPI0003293D1D|nr:NAD(P)H-binding protein [Actinoplanes sp. N902-109]AGL17779.1 nucleoside-diphosphate-sugar epimerase-like protein [Actinoplanes sp. N902-109]
MRILVVGGSGLIGARFSEVARQRGHGVSTVARTARPGVDHVLDVRAASVAEWRPVLAGHDAVVFAARTDEQRPVPKPVLPEFRAAMVDPVARLFTAARAEGLTRGAVMGSYYTHFHRLHPQWRLAARHAYIRSRVEQAQQARAAAGADLPVAIIELPFVVGRAGGRPPNWAGGLDRWVRSRVPLLAPRGGTAVASVSSVADITVTALDQRSGADLPVADANLSWRELLGRIATAAGRPRRVGRLPAPPIRAALEAGGALGLLTRREPGLNPVHFAQLLLTELFVQPVTGRSLDEAMRDTFSRPA